MTDSDLTEAEMMLIDNHSKGLNEALLHLKTPMMSINTLNKKELDSIQKAGFPFGSTSVADRKLELKKFLQDHLCCGSDDMYTLRLKLQYYVDTKLGPSVDRTQRRAKKSRMVPKKLIVEVEEEEDAYDEEEEMPKPRPRKRTVKSSKKTKVFKIEKDLNRSDQNDSDEEEDQRTPQKPKTKKSKTSKGPKPSEEEEKAE